MSYLNWWSARRLVALTLGAAAAGAVTIVLLLLPDIVGVQVVGYWYRLALVLGGVSTATLLGALLESLAHVRKQEETS